MQYMLENDVIRLTVDSLGAQMLHLQSADGVEYLWQGDPASWEDRAPNLFPFIGRLTDNTYTFLGKVYPMGIHGFAASEEFQAVSVNKTKLVLVLRSNENTRSQYPFSFSFQITYGLEGDRLDISFRVENLSDEIMPFGVGGHPGFNVPLIEGERFEDYELVFSCPCRPDRVGFTPSVYLSGRDEEYRLRQNRYMDLRHDLFDEDAVILKNMAREVVLRSKRSNMGVKVSYPDFPYLGIWHWPKTEAPYVCIEPWTSLPSRQGVVEEISCKSDMVQLAPGKIFVRSWSITLLMG